MKNYWKAIGIAVVAAGVLYYPVVKLYKYLQDKKTDDNGEDEHHIIKQFAPAYRGGKHNKGHHPRTTDHMDAGTGLA